WQKQVRYGTLFKDKHRYKEDILNKLILKIIYEDSRLFKKYIILQKETNLIKKECLINRLIDELVGTEKLLRNNPPKKNKYKKVTVSEILDAYYNVQEISGDDNERKDLKQKQDIELDAIIALEKLINNKQSKRLYKDELESTEDKKQKKEEILKTEAKLRRLTKETNMGRVKIIIGVEKEIRVAVDKCKILRYTNIIVQRINTEGVNKKKAFK
ncbi:2660_t:CDS:2, partial [Scutellospora calospora]